MGCPRSVGTVWISFRLDGYGGFLFWNPHDDDIDDPDTHSFQDDGDTMLGRIIMTVFCVLSFRVRFGLWGFIDTIPSPNELLEGWDKTLFMGHRDLPNDIGKF